MIVMKYAPFSLTVRAASMSSESVRLSRMMSLKPRMAVIGVRISWLMLARNSDFERSAAIARSLESRSSSSIL